MANPEHLDRLGEGMASWNSWRAQNPGLRVDLSSANLRGNALAGKNGIGFDFSGANLSLADLGNAKLGEAMCRLLERHHYSPQPNESEVGSCPGLGKGAFGATPPRKR